MTTKDWRGVRDSIARCQAGLRDRPIFICFFGDSITQGWGNESIQYREAYPTRLLEALHDRYPRSPFNGINSGQPGDTLSQALSRLERDVLRYDPDLTILCFGVNDAMGGLEALPRFRESLHAAIQAIRTRSAVILLTPNMMATRRNTLVPQSYQDQIDTFVAAQTNGVLDAFVDAIRSAAREMNIPLADAYRIWQVIAASSADTDLLLANGINHPFGHAHRFFVEAILRCIDETLA